MATAEYRLGNYEACIAAALKSVELTPTELGPSGPHPVNLAILTMSHSKLGKADKSRKYREFFESAMKTERWKDEKECLSFANEVYEMLGKPE